MIWRLKWLAVAWLTLCGATNANASATVDVDIEVNFLASKHRSGSVADNVDAWLAIVSRKASDEGIGSVAMLTRLHQQAPAQIRQALMPYGYYSPEISSSLKHKDTDRWQARYVIDTGPATRVTAVNLVLADPDTSGSADVSVDVSVQELRLAAEATLGMGQRLRHHRYEQAKKDTLSRLLALGYLDAAFTEARLEVDPTQHSAVVNWVLAPGTAYEFGTITVEQDILRDEFVARYLDVREGQRFNTDRLIQAQLALNNSNYFASVALDIQRDAASDGRVPVVFRTTRRKRQRYSAGLGYGTDTGPRVSAGLATRRVNDRGHKYRINTRFSQIETSVQAEYDIPIKNVASDRWRFSALAEDAQVGDADARQYALGIAREDSWGPFRRRTFLNAERTSFQFGDEPVRRSTIIYPGATLSWDRLDDPEFVRRGVSLSITAQGGSSSVGSETSFVSLGTSGRFIRGLSPRMRLLAALDARYLTAGSFERLPPSQRFFLGGDRSVRGYAFQGISPENAAGDDIGGSHSVSGSLEVDYQLGANFGLAVFADAGGVSFDWPNDLQTALGLGLRYRSPVGMIRLDLAHPLDDSSRDVRVHLSIGPDL